MEIARKKIDPKNITDSTLVIEIRLLTEEEIKSSKLIHRAGDYVGREFGWFGKKLYAVRNIWECFDSVVEMMDVCTDKSYSWNNCFVWRDIMKENDDLTHLIYKPHVEIVKPSGAVEALFFDTLEEAAKAFNELAEKHNLE